MTTLPLGIGAYQRSYASAPEVKCLNRFVERMPTNLKEHVALLSRPPTKLLDYFAADTSTGKLRGFFYTPGMFNNDLFVVSGHYLYRYDGATATRITGEIAGTGSPHITFVKGAGYERLWVSDEATLQYYDGGSQATGTLTDDGSATYVEVLNINGTYYGWNASVDTGTPDGTSGYPFLCAPGTDPMQAMADMLNLNGTPGVDFSTALTTPNLDVTAESTTTTLTLSARVHTAAGNLINVSVNDTTHLSWGAAYLSGGGIETLYGALMPGGQTPGAVATLNSFVFVAVKDSQRFYFIRPAEKTVDSLDFATKEYNPDPIVDMKTLGDVVVIMGSGSIEFWAPTGTGDNPFAPVEGRTMSRGVVPGTAVVVDETTVMIVGNDFRVYAIAGGGSTRVSDHGIEERIRRQIQREKGLTT